MAAAKTVCPVDRAKFRAEAKDVLVTIDGKAVVAEAREFSTGSLGWYANGKVTLEVGGVKVPVQVGVTLTLVGSKELP
jgi:hypothetical protein